MRAPAWVPFAFLAPALLGLFVFRATPIGISLIGGLFGTSLTGETTFQGLANYAALMEDPDFWNSVRVTLLFNLVINPLQVAVAFGLALITARPGKLVGLFRTAYFLPITVSIALTSVLWNILLNPGMGPVQSLLRALDIPTQPFFRSQGQALASIIGIASWRGCGYWMFFMLAGLGTIPRETYEAAAIDGANPFQRMRHITLPLMRRTFAFVLVADTAANFLLFAPVYIITNGGPNGATSLLMFEAYRAAFSYLDQGRSLAISSMILFCIAAVAFIEFRFVRGEDVT